MAKSAQPVQDTIEFPLMAEYTIVNTTVKLTAHISGMITPDVTEDSLRDTIRDMLKRFVDTTKYVDTTWQISNTNRSRSNPSARRRRDPQRQRTPSGMEQIALTATVRVPESEHYALDERAAAVSIKGMTIARADVDTAPSQEMIDDAERKLRVVLLKKATEELKLINKSLESTYRLGSVVFSPNPTTSTSNMRSSNASMAKSPFQIEAFYSGNGGDAGSSALLGNAVKMTIYAEIELRQSH